MSDIQRALLKHCLKPNEITGDAQTKSMRAGEIVRWFIRYANGDANPKWVVGHAFELAHYVIDLESQLAATQQRLTECERDAGRLNVIAELVDEHGGLRIHNGDFNGRGHVGMGLANTDRNLRAAVDEAMGRG